MGWARRTQLLQQWQNSKQCPSFLGTKAPLWRGTRQVRDKRPRLQTGVVGKMGKEPGLDQAAHLAHSRGQRELKEFWRWTEALQPPSPASYFTEAESYSATCSRSQNQWVEDQGPESQPPVFKRRGHKCYHILTNCINSFLCFQICVWLSIWTKTERQNSVLWW